MFWFLISPPSACDKFSNKNNIHSETSCGLSILYFPTKKQNDQTQLQFTRLSLLAFYYHSCLKMSNLQEEVEDNKDVMF